MSWSRKSSERLRKKRWAKEKRERDRLSKEAKGEAGHRQCGRKGRYPDEISALLAATLGPLTERAAKDSEKDSDGRGECRRVLYKLALWNRREGK